MTTKNAIATRGKSTASRRRELTAIVEALVPIAKLCLHTGKGAGEMILATKLACVEVAAKNSALAGRLNHSQIAVITGLTRKEVKALTSIEAMTPETRVGRPRRLGVERVLTGWATDPQFLNRLGEPLMLRVSSANNGFGNLVRKYAGDVTPKAVLRELQRVGAVSQTIDGRVRLRKSHIRAKGFTLDAVVEIAHRLRDLGSTLIGNVEAIESPIYAAFRNINGLTPDETALFRATFSERMASLLNSVSIWTRSQTRLKKITRGGSQKRPTDTGIGLYITTNGRESAPANNILSSPASKRRTVRRVLAK